MDPKPVVETHISILTFLDGTVRKRRKAVNLGFLDFTSLDARRLDCEREVALNRRLAPDVYLGVEPVLDDAGIVVDYESVMWRLPDDRRLATIATHQAPEAERAISDVAERLARFHRSSSHSPAIDACATTAAMLARWHDTCSRLERIEWIDDSELADVRSMATDYLAGREPLFSARIDAGRAVDGHGDLLAEDIFWLDDGARILDCLEFDEHLRFGDGMLDAAFLAMDLERLGRHDLGTMFLAEYGALADDSPPPSLLDHFIAHRAVIRALVHALRDQPNDTRHLLELAHTHLRSARVRLVLVGGAPGTGKSTVAQHIADARGWELLRSDALRKETMGVPKYSDQAIDANYRALIERARQELSMGHSVVLDATWAATEHRDAARAAAAATRSHCISFECELDERTAGERIAQRRAAGIDESDADARISASIRARFAPWAEAQRLDASAPPGDVAATALGILAEG